MTHVHNACIKEQFLVSHTSHDVHIWREGDNILSCMPHHITVTCHMIYIELKRNNHVRCMPHGIYTHMNIEIERERETLMLDGNFCVHWAMCHASEGRQQSTRHMITHDDVWTCASVRACFTGSDCKGEGCTLVEATDGGITAVCGTVACSAAHPCCRAG